MPISEDEYDHHPGQPQHAMSKAEQRRSNKPIMEKRRRARINHCLNELKSLILDAMKKDPARHSKLEKADILEMTVKHLQSVQRQQLAVAVATDPAVLHKFKTGFNECAGEVSRYIGRLDGVEPAVKQRLVSHLAHCVSGLQQLTPLAFTAAVQPPAPPPQQPATAPAAAAPVAAAGDVNNNRGAAAPAAAAAAAAAGLQLIPSRLPTGEFALLLPGGGNLQGLPFFPAPPAPTGAAATAATLIDRSHPSAFTAVDRPRRTPPPHGAPPSAYQHPPPPLSPASSVSSGDDCSFTSEPYLSSSSPPPPPALQPPPPLQPQLPPPVPAPAPATSSPNAFKPPPPPTTESQPALASAPAPAPPPPHKTTASVGVGTVTEVKLEFKTIPVHGTAVFPIITTSPSPAAVATSAAVTTLSVAAPSSVHQPLTVITTQPSVSFKSATGTVTAPSIPSVTFCAPAIKDPPLDFSIKKDEHPHQQSASTQTTSSLGMKRSLPANFSITDPSDSSSTLMFASPNKIPRYSLHIKTETDVAAMHTSPRILEQPTAPTGGPLLKVATPKHHYSTVGEDLTNKPSQSSTSTSTSDGASSASTSANDASQPGNKDMWRPW